MSGLTEWQSHIKSRTHRAAKKKINQLKIQEEKRKIPGKSQKNDGNEDNNNDEPNVNLFDD